VVPTLLLRLYIGKKPNVISTRKKNYLTSKKTSSILPRTTGKINIGLENLGTSIVFILDMNGINTTRRIMTRTTHPRKLFKDTSSTFSTRTSLINQRPLHTKSSRSRATMRLYFCTSPLDPLMKTSRSELSTANGSSHTSVDFEVASTGAVCRFGSISGAISIVNKITWSLEMQIDGVLSLISVECKITVLLCVSRGQQVFKLVKRSDALRLCYHFFPEPTRPNNGLFWQFCPSLSITLRILALPNII